jgi:hypothetical protein
LENWFEIQIQNKNGENGLETITNLKKKEPKNNVNFSFEGMVGQLFLQCNDVPAYVHSQRQLYLIIQTHSK